ncbi:MAG: hypothetical protein U9Q63_00400 [Patescibacteria group bacterium]|nr:hypothetical protein [Patescibacteria group bacterium]
MNIGEAFKLNDSQTVQEVFSTPGDLLTLVVKNIYVIAGIILFFFIIAGGLSIILNAGNPEKTKQGGKTIGSAIAGFVILFASYWIIRIIEALTGIQILGGTS